MQSSSPWKRRRHRKTPGVGYMRHRVNPEQLTVIGQWLIIEEIFENSEQPSGIVIARQGTQTTVRGRILRAGPECAIDGLEEGDEVIYEQWAGGRHSLGGRNVLIMSVDRILCKVEDR